MIIDDAKAQLVYDQLKSNNGYKGLPVWENASPHQREYSRLIVAMAAEHPQWSSWKLEKEIARLQGHAATSRKFAYLCQIARNNG